MIKYLFDTPNAVTICGLTIIITSIYFITISKLDIALVLLMWAVMLDHIDGWLARRTKNRKKEFALVGGDMDSATDMVSASIVPGMMTLIISQGTLISLVGSIMLAISACLRVGYFNNFGLTDSGKFYGVPLTYTVPVIVLTFIINKFVSGFNLKEYLPYILIVMSILHVCPFGPPPVKGIGFLVVLIYALFATYILLLN
ncbi:hypothetical protein CI789_05460 [Erwinia persicina]|nr:MULTISPECIES: CDP-alcohol phosphatidyltransferase family protein [Enterobacterales]AXU94727.1 hypothetical protein CI789_05460 [Erwinia persicina]MCR9002113.1 CDP-alcohol phosphatidyltransferase family protein [Rahnella perminowiae]MCX2946578.1 CDP-alcohol phosphatidyltransferase family protein [Rahnella perminowiae]